MQKFALSITLLLFAALTGVALFHHGYIGIFTPMFETSATLQVLVDLIIALSLFLVWMWNDAKQSGRSPYLWILLTLSTGSIGALLYLITRKKTA